jgi:hypothetical protein
MAEHWHDTAVSGIHIRDDGGDAPDDWENESEEQVCLLYDYF